MSDVIRLISASGSDFEKMTPMELKESIFKSEGRVIMGQPNNTQFLFSS